MASSPHDAGSPGTTTRPGSGGATVPVGAASSGVCGPGGRAGATAGSGGVVTPYELVVNGVARRVDGARASDSLLHVLRDRLGLPGAKNACEQGECGSCSVLVDGVLVCACLELAEAVTGCAVTTVEGLEPAGAEPSDAALGGDVLTDVQRAMVEAGGVQCGFCTPGFVVAIHDLLARVPEPGPFEVREALAGNLCRCTGYGRILAAVEQVVSERSSVGGETASGGPAPWQAAGSEPRGSA